MTGGTMLCGTCLAPNEFALVERPRPTEAPPGHVLLDVAAVGICGTDYHILDGTQPYLAYPRVIGHELSARVAVSGEGWEAGTLVVVNPYLACGTCRACRRGKPNCCERIQVLGVHRDGGLCARIAVPAGNLIDAGDLSELDAAMVEFLAIGAHAVRRSEVGPGDRALVVGAGPIGLGAAIFARLAGAEVHLLDTSPERLALAGRVAGFDRLHVVGEEPAEVFAGGFDAVFDATGSARAMEGGFARVAHGGSLVLVSVVQGRIGFEDPEFHKREMRVVGSRNALGPDFRQAMGALRSGAIDGAALRTEVLTLSDFAGRFADLARDRGHVVKAVVTP